MALDVTLVKELIKNNADAMQQAFEASTTAGGRPPALKLKTASSDACKEGAIPVNHYALESSSQIRDLGKEPQGLVIAFRAKAIDFGDGSEGSSVSSTADINSDEFKRIKAVVATNQPNNHCACGPEFLIYLPEENVYAELFLSSWNAKGFGAEHFFNALKSGSPIKLTSAMREGKHGKNFYPVCEQVTTELDLSGTNNAEFEEKVIAFQALAQPALSEDAGEDDGR